MMESLDRMIYEATSPPILPLVHQMNVPEDDQVLFYTSVHPQYPDTMLIANYSPSRARKDREDRNRMLEKLQKKLASSSDEASIKNVISNGGYKKICQCKSWFSTYIK